MEYLTPDPATEQLVPSVAVFIFFEPYASNQERFPLPRDPSIHDSHIITHYSFNAEVSALSVASLL